MNQFTDELGKNIKLSEEEIIKDGEEINNIPINKQIIDTNEEIINEPPVDNEKIDIDKFPKIEIIKQRTPPIIDVEPIHELQIKKISERRSSKNDVPHCIEKEKHVNFSNETQIIQSDLSHQKVHNNTLPVITKTVVGTFTLGKFLSIPKSTIFLSILFIVIAVIIYKNEHCQQEHSTEVKHKNKIIQNKVIH